MVAYELGRVDPRTSGHAAIRGSGLAESRTLRKRHELGRVAWQHGGMAGRYLTRNNFMAAARSSSIRKVMYGGGAVLAVVVVATYGVQAWGEDGQGDGVGAAGLGVLIYFYSAASLVAYGALIAVVETGLRWLRSGRQGNRA
jgi:hypothetical protein